MFRSLPVRRTFFLSGLLTAAFAAHAFETARMQLPDGFESKSERIAAKGFGGHNKGRYELGGWRGEFTRSESRLGIFDPLWSKNSGRSTFTLEHESAAGALAAECEMSKSNVTVGVVTFDPKKMSYRCDFRRDGRLTGARLLLGQPKPGSFGARLAAKAERRGEAVIDDVHIGIASVHRYQGTKLTSQTPVGYWLDIGGEVVAAVELTDWNPTVFLPAGAGPAERQSVLAVALALAVLRDPEDSALGE